MTQVTVTVDDSEVRMLAERVTLAVERLPAKVIREEVKKGVKQASRYPPELPNQRYRRTGTYGRSFKIEPVGKGFRMSSDARQRGRRYTKYVGGLADGSGQASIHARRWQLIRTSMLDVMQSIVDKAGDYFRAILERNGAP